MKKLPPINSLVTLNRTPEAALWRVKEVDGFRVGIVARDNEDMPRVATQWVDRAQCHTPSIGQLAKLKETA